MSVQQNGWKTVSPGRVLAKKIGIWEMEVHLQQGLWYWGGVVEDEFVIGDQQGHETAGQAKWWASRFATRNGQRHKPNERHER